MSLSKKNVYLDDWKDVKKKAAERAEAAEQAADNRSVTKDFVKEQISDYEQKDKAESDAVHKEINDRITKIVAGDGEYYTKDESDEKFAIAEDIPSKTSQLSNDSGFITANDIDLSGKANVADVYTKEQADQRFQLKGEGGSSEPQDLSEYAKIADVSANFQPKGDYLTEHQDISGKADASTVFTKDETRAEIANQIATIVADAPEDFNTLKEIADYIAGDKTKASQIENSIADISTALSDKADADSVYNKDEVYTKEQAGELFQPKGETQDLSEYAKIADVSANFQEKGDYLTANDVSTKANANEVYSITDADNTFLKQSDYNPQDLSEYAKIVDVSTNFQEKGEYLTASDIDGKANVGDSYTKAEADSTFQPKGDYLTEHQDISGKIDSSLVYTKEQADELFQPKGETQDLSEYAKIVDVSANFQEKGEYLTASDIDGKANVGDSYTKDESDNKYQEKGDYLTANDVSTKAEKSDVDTLKNNVWDNTNGYFKTVKDSTKGQAMLWNETDGGGAMFTQSNGVKSFAGVNNGEGEKGITAQIYTVDTTNGNKGPRVTLTENGAFYSKDVTNVTEDFEIATKGDLTGFATTDAVNTKADASVVYTKQETDNAIETQVANKIAEIVADAPKDLDTLKEVADYIASDKTKAAEIETAISNINSSLGTKANANEVYTVVEADEKFLTEHQDISGKADKSDVDALKANVWNGSNENGFFKTTNDSERGQAMLWNESTGGGAMFSQNNGVKSFAGVNDGAGEKGITAQIYTVNTSDGNKGPRVTLTENGAFYSKDVTNVTEDFEIATKGDLTGFATTDAVNAKANSADVYDTSTADSIFLKKDEYTPVEPQDLSDYAKTVDVSANFQPKGNYLTEHQDISGKADADTVYTKDEVYTKNQADDKFLTASDITGKANTEDVYSKTDADAKFLTANDVSTKAEAEDVYTKTVADETFLKQSDYNPQDLSEYAKIVDVSANFQEKGEYLTASDIEGKANVGDSYTKAESDEKFQLKGEYLTAVDVSTKIDRSETETLIATEVAKIVSGAPEDFDTLKEVADYITGDKTKAAEIEISISSINSSINIINASLENKANSADVYTMTVADEKFQPVGNYLTEHQDISGKIDSSLVYTKEQADELFQPKGETQDLSEYAKTVDVSANFQEKGDYLTAIDISTKVDASDVYNKTDIDNTINVINTSINDISKDFIISKIQLSKNIIELSEQTDTINSSVNTIDASVRDLYINGSSSADTERLDEIETSISTINTSLATKVNASDVYNKTDIDNTINVINTSINDISEDFIISKILLSKNIIELSEQTGTINSSVNTLDASVRDLYINGSSSADTERLDEIETSISTINSSLATKANSADVYTKSEVYTQEQTTQAIATEVAKIVANAPEDFDTLKEIADYIASDKTKAAQIETSISTINSSLDTKANASDVYNKTDIDNTINVINTSINTLDTSVRDLYINGSGSSESPVYQKEGQSGYVLGREWGNNTVGYYSFAEGKDTSAIGNYSHAEGNQTTASGLYSHAEGRQTTASGSSSHAEGYSTTASKWYSHAEGHGTTASGDAAHAEGTGTTAIGTASHAEGKDTSTLGLYSHAEGRGTIASGEASHAEGYYTQASNEAEHASGMFNKSTSAKTRFSVGVGTDNINRKNAFEIAIDGSVYINGIGSYNGTNVTSAKNIQSVVKTIDASVRDLYINGSGSSESPVYQKQGQNGYVLGREWGNNAVGFYSFAEGNDTSAKGSCSHAEGDRTQAAADYSHAEGFRTKALNGFGAHAEGVRSTATAEASHAEGYDTSAIGSYSHTEGYSTIASGNNGSHAEGYYTIASGYNAHAEGYKTTASGSGAHAEGDDTSALGSYSHAEGRETIASAEYSHTEGFRTKALNSFCAHAEGSNTIASGESSHAEGDSTEAKNFAEHASGKYNKSTSGKTQFSVGVGTDNINRKNAFEIAIDGSVYINGIGSYNGTNVTSAMNIQDVIKTINASVNTLEESGGSGDGGSSSIEITPDNCFFNDYTSGEDTPGSTLPTLNDISAYENRIVNAKVFKQTIDDFAEAYTDYLVSPQGVYQYQNPILRIYSEYINIDTTIEPEISITEADIDSSNLTFNVNGFISANALASIKSYIDAKFDALEQRIYALEHPGA